MRAARTCGTSLRRSAGVAALALALAGCGPPGRGEIRRDVVDARFDEVEKKLNQRYGRHLVELGEGTDASGPSRHVLLWRMERGAADFIQGEWLNSLYHLRSAARFAREFRTASVARGLAAAVVNDNLTRFGGEPFEHAFVPYYGMLAGLLTAQRTDGTWVPAAAPAPQAPSALPEPEPTESAETYYDRAASGAIALEEVQRATREQEFGRRDYRVDPFLHLMAAAVRHATARGSDDQQAAILYAERALAAYAAAGGMPAAGRAIAARILAGDAERLAAAGLEAPPQAEGTGLLVVVEELGYVPKREALQVYAVAGAPPRASAVDIGGLFVWVDGPGVDELQRLHGAPLPGTLVRDIVGSGIGVFGFELPVLPPPGARPAAGRLAIGEARFALEPVDDVEAHARVCFADHRARRLVATITRTVAKLIAVRVGVDAIDLGDGGGRRGGHRRVEDNPLRDLIFAAASFAATASEQADVRSWTLLPNRIAAAAVPLAPGEHLLTLVQADGVQRPLGRVRMRPGALVVLTARSFPAGVDHIGRKD